MEDLSKLQQAKESAKCLWLNFQGQSNINPRIARAIADNPIDSLIDLEDPCFENTTQIERFVKKDGSASLEVDSKFRTNNSEL